MRINNALTQTPRGSLGKISRTAAARLCCPRSLHSRTLAITGTTPSSPHSSFIWNHHKHLQFHRSLTFIPSLARKYCLDGNQDRDESPASSRFPRGSEMPTYSACDHSTPTSGAGTKIDHASPALLRNYILDYDDENEYEGDFQKRPHDYIMEPRIINSSIVFQRELLRGTFPPFRSMSLHSFLGYRSVALFSTVKTSPLPFSNLSNRQGTNTLMSTSNQRYHTSLRNERTAAILLGLGAASAAFYAASSAVGAYNEYKASLPTPEQVEADQLRREGEQAAKDTAEKAQSSTTRGSASSQPKGATSSAYSSSSNKKENIFTKWFGVDVGVKYYEGGFEPVMTRREAALILGVRESSSPARIKDAHRKLLILNHPDTGGSTYLSGKINEAKELLLKGKRGM